jgi:phosphoglycerate kinase
MSKLSVRDLDLKNKNVLIRVDFNVPLDKNGKITDDTRIRASLPTIQYVLDQGGRVILISHLGRPKDGPIPSLSLAPCAKHLSELLKKDVKLAPDCVGVAVQRLVKDLKPEQVLLLENVRFHAAEEKPELDSNFAKELSTLGDCYVNDAFGTAHRAHSSTAEICRYFPGLSAMGLLMEKEVHFLGELLLNPQRPFYAIIGGAKISSKIGVIKSLLQKADAIFVGGGMAYNFSKAKGIEIGESIHDDAYLPVVKEILEASRTSKAQLYLPEDYVIADRIAKDAQIKVISADQAIPNGFQGVDIGPATIKKYVNLLQSAATVFWNGPLGVFECSPFEKGTIAIAQALSQLKAKTIVGGGESISAIYQAGVADRITHLSTGGGASLEFLEAGTLPGIQSLSDKKV